MTEPTGKLPPCPTPCDPGCDAGCHEEHQPLTRRAHQLWACTNIRQAIAAARPSQPGHAPIDRRTIITGSNERMIWQQVGWHGQTGALYAAHEQPSATEPGGFSPLWVLADSEQLPDERYVHTATVAARVHAAFCWEKPGDGRLTGCDRKKDHPSRHSWEFGDTIANATCDPDIRAIPEGAPQHASYWYRQWLAAQEELDREAVQRIELRGDQRALGIPKLLAAREADRAASATAVEGM